MRTSIAIALIAATAVVAATTTVSATHLISGSDIKDGSITSADIKDRSIKPRDLAFDREASHRIYSNHEPKGGRMPRDEGGYVYMKPDSSWTQVDTLYGLPAGMYMFSSAMSIRYNMAGALDVQCGFQPQSGSTAIQGIQELQLNLVSNKVNQYQVFPMSPVVFMSLPQGGDVDLVCRSIIQGAASAEAYNTYLYAEPVSSYSHT